VQDSPSYLKATEPAIAECAKQGLFKHAIPSCYGGYNDTFATLIQAHEDWGGNCHDPGTILSINAHLWGAVFPVLQHGSAEQKQNILPALIDGRLIAGHAITEPQSGSDLGSMEGIATASAQGFRISCHKRYITNAPIADFVVVYVRVENDLCAFIVRSDDPGVCITDSPAVSGCVTAPMGDVILNDCFVSDDRLLGKFGAGSFILQQAMELERAFIFAGILGVMTWQLEEVIEYSRQRMIAGNPLGHKQSISHRIADMKTRLDSVRLWVQHCAALKDKRQRLMLASAQTKLFAGEAFLQSSLDAVQIFGASGLVDENPISQLVQDAMASRLFSGSSEIQKNIIAALLGTGESYCKPATK